ncbi:response regulator transcription factor [Paenibacillus whitsoniae]|uniref:Response regulator n=1 Tax=Paenibacillus whitsoniae TaxID=2496558 RepID=A0A3S0AS11_9BACL|nr:response regulator [Paenibacillus whitsoniae]RTE11266.1 response regulator [Paenibacillus whitsoniae]
MYTLLIVDDEVYIANKVKASVDWDQLGISKVFVAYNIRQAKEIFESHSIDVMICDIEMPQGNGLELLTWAREKYLKTESIFLTCHADFEYSKQALRLGSLDYLLKPVPENELKEVVQKAIYKIKTERPLVMERFWLDLLQQSIPSHPEAIKKALFEKSIPLSETASILPILIGVQHWEKKLSVREEHIMEYALRKTAEELILQQGNKGQIIQVKTGLILVILELERESVPTEEKLKELCEAFIEASHQYFYCQVSCYIGELTRIPNMLAMYDQLMYLHLNNVSLSKQVIASREQSVKTQDIPWPQMNIWAEMMKQGDKKKLHAEITSTLHSWKQIEGLDAQSLRQFYQSFLQMLLYTLQQNGLKSDQLFKDQLSPDRALIATRSVNDLQSWVQDVLEITFIQQNEGESESLVDRIKHYITSHIDQPLSRQYIADYIGLSPDYLVKLFKKETAISISDYITQERIRISKELLAHSDLPVSSIAQAVGYSNFAYFSTTFKKEVSMTPQDYRRTSR